MGRIFLFFLGMFFCSVGLAFGILYLNLMTMGYSFWNMVHFIISRFECQLFFFGILLMILSWKGRYFCELLLRCRVKF